MDSEATSLAPPLSPTHATPAPPSGSASLSSPAGSGPDAAYSPFSPPAAEEECLPREEGEPGVGTVVEQPLGPVPKEKADAQEELGDGAEPEGLMSGTNGEKGPFPVALPEDPATVPEAGLLGERDGIAQEVLDDGLAVAPSPPGEAAGGVPGLVVGEGDEVQEDKGGDDDEDPSAMEVWSSDGNSNLVLKPDDGVVPGAEEDEVEESLADWSSAKEVGVLGEANHGRTFSEISIGEEAGEDGTLHEHPMVDDASGDGAAAVLGDEQLQNPVEDKHVHELCAGIEEETIPDAGVIGSSEAVKLQSCSGVTNGVVDNDIFDGESKEEAALGSETGEEESSQESKPSEMKQRIDKVEKDDALKVVAVSADSGETDHLQKPNHLGSSGIIAESFPLVPKAVGNEIEQAFPKLQENSENGKPKLDTDEGDMFSAREVGLLSILSEDSKTELDSHASMVLDVAHYENAPVTSIADSNQGNMDDGSGATDEGKYMGLDEGSEGDDLLTDGYADIAILETSESAKHIIRELGEGSLGPSSGFGNSDDYSDEVDGQIVSDSDEGVSDEEGDGKELFNSAALTALLKAATEASSDNGITITASDATRIFSVDRPAGLGSSVPSLNPTPPRMNRMNVFSPSDLAVLGEPEDNMDEEEKQRQEKVEEVRVKFLRLVHRLGHCPEDRVAAQVLYRLGLAEGLRHGRQIGRAFSLENTKKKALQLEEEGKEPLDFSCNILVLGKTGVGKSATINSIFGEDKVHTNAFYPATTSIREIIGTVDGVKVCVVDTPGLKSSVMDQNANKRILTSIKKYMKKCPPDIVLYVDRLDTQTWDFNDLPLLREIASTVGSSIWFNAIVALTHAASAPPDGPSGSPLSYEVFVDQRSRVVQHAIRQAAGDMRLMNPVALVENHPSCRRNREGERVLPNGLSWRTQMLLLCYSSKILSEANSVLKLQDLSPGKLFGFRVRSPPLPFLLSSLLQSRSHPKLATDQGGDNGDSDIDVGDLSDSDQEQEEDEYDQLPPFKPLRKAQIAKLTKEQRKAYFDEYDYRVKLLQKKQWKEELRRSKEMKKRGKAGQDESGYGDVVDDYDQDGAPAAIPVPLPDMVLPPSFDCDNPAYRYRFLEPTSQLLVRPVLDSHGWDHDCGYDGVSIEENLAIASKFPAGISVQITKDKKEFNIHLDSSISARHGETGSTLAGVDIQSVGKQLAYILRSETKFKNLKKNKTAAGISVTFLGENIATGLKVEDQLLIGKRLGLVASTGAVRAQGDMAYGANLEMRFRDKDFPIGQDLSTLGLSLMRWRRDLALGANLQSQFSIGRNSKMAVRVGLNNKLSGQITVRTSTSEHLQIALLGFLPVAISVYRSIWSSESD